MGGHVNQTWTDEQSAVLIEMLANGSSYAEISEALNEQFGTNYSRNAACGKGFRLKVTAPRKVRPPRKERKRTERIQIVKPIPKVESIRIRCAEIKPKNVDLLDLSEDGCRYPSGDGPFVFCNHTQQDGFPYCPAHQALCHAKEPKITDEERQIRRQRWIKLQKFTEAT